MHIEKNVCDSIIGTLLNIKGKMKDGVNARKDMAKLRPKLDAELRQDGKYQFEPACYDLSTYEKRIYWSFCSLLEPHLATPQISGVLLIWLERS